jgi:ACS family tartrate transporter-like MFS transporter
MQSLPLKTELASLELSRDRLMAKISWRLLPFMMVLYVVSYLDRINLSFAALQMNAELQFRPEVYGLGSGIFFLGYCAFGIPSNLIIGRLGPRLWISLIMIAWGLVTVAMVLVRDSQSFYALRLLLGVAEAGFFPGMLLYLTYWFPQKQYCTAVARFMTAVPIAGVIGSLMAAKTLAMGGIAGLSGWKWLFIVTGVPAILLGVCVYFWLTDRPSEAKWLNEGEQALLVDTLASEKTKGDSQTSGSSKAESRLDSSSESSIRAALTSVIVWRAALLYFSMSACMYGFQLWLPQIIRTFGQATDSQIALFSALPALAQGLGMQVIALSSDNRKERSFHIVASSIITCLGLSGACLLPGAELKLASMCFAAFGIWASLGPFWALTRQSLKPVAQPAGIAFINSIGGLGGFAGPFLVGLVQQANVVAPGTSPSFFGALVLLAGTSVMTAILAIISRPKDSC